MDKEYLIQTESATGRRHRLMEQGQIELASLGISPDDYAVQTNLMRQADAPIGQAIQVLDKLDGFIITPSEALEAWSDIKSIFDKIDISKYDQASGVDILNEMKQCVNECIKLLKELTSKYDGQEITEPIKLPDNLQSLKTRMKELKTEFGQLPAYLSYRKVGIYTLDESTIPKDEWFRERGNRQSEQG